MIGDMHEFLDGIPFCDKLNYKGDNNLLKYANPDLTGVQQPRFALISNGCVIGMNHLSMGSGAWIMAWPLGRKPSNCQTSSFVDLDICQIPFASQLGVPLNETPASNGIGQQYFSQLARSDVNTDTVKHIGVE